MNKIWELRQGRLHRGIAESSTGVTRIKMKKHLRVKFEEILHMAFNLSQQIFVE